MSALRWYDWLLLIVSVLLILIIVLQTSKDDAANTFSGKKSELFSNKKSRGPERVVEITTTCLSIAFFVLAVVAWAVARF